MKYLEVNKNNIFIYFLYLYLIYRINILMSFVKN